MKEVAIVSDSHIPSRASEVPERVRNEIEKSSHVIHAGDFDSAEALNDFREISLELTAVYGNMDNHDLDLPGINQVEIEQATQTATEKESIDM